MAVVSLKPPLRDLADGCSHLEVEGSTVAEVVGTLERTYPRLTGWIRDEHGLVRPHVHLFLNGERAGLDAEVGAEDLLYVLPAISGGAVGTAVAEEEDLLDTDPAEMAELLVGTRKGLFVLRGQRGGPMQEAERKFSGQIVEFAMRDPRTGTYFASVTHGQHGPRLFFTDDPSGEWDQADGPAFPEDAEWSLERIWSVTAGVEAGVLWAGVAPAALFKSEDGGKSWELNRGLWNEPSRKDWQPGAGGMCLHSICPWPGDPAKLLVGISAAGVWVTEDGGETWAWGGEGLVPRYLPEEARAGAKTLCVHNVHRAALEPTTLYLQFHGGVYRSDDEGYHWQDVGTDTGLPADFGFPLVSDPNDPDRAYVIPLTGDFDRVLPDGRVRVYVTNDRGGSWQPLDDGLPSDNSYLTVLRQAFGHDGRDPLGLYFGAESGEVFGSADNGQTWRTVVEHLPPVTSVRCSA
jgi:photosystem II stability/assembly factor-like uncharacterized protein/molybdopterin converting factor small subunit